MGTRLSRDLSPDKPPSRARIRFFVELILAAAAAKYLGLPNLGPWLTSLL